MSGISKDLTVIGTIEVDGRINRVSLPLPLLVQDGMLFMGALAGRYFEEAEQSKSIASSLCAIAENILAAASGSLVKSGSGLADIRLALRPLVVREESYTDWCRALLSVSTRPSTKEDRFSFRISSRGLEVCQSLSWIGEYTSACDFDVSGTLVTPNVSQLVFV